MGTITARGCSRAIGLAFVILVCACVPTEPGEYVFWCNAEGCTYWGSEQNYEFPGAETPCPNGSSTGSYSVYDDGSTDMHCPPPPPGDSDSEEDADDDGDDGGG